MQHFTDDLVYTVMKITIVAILAMLFSQNLVAQSDSLNAQAARYFKEISEATRRHKKLWNRNLYSNMLLVNPTTRKFYGNAPDSANTFIAQQGIYSGSLPADINIANTAVSWKGKTWAMIMLPLAKNKHERVNLLAHELFHTQQSFLGFQQHNKESKHLDQREGRIYLRLELEALKKALESATSSAQQKHLSHAITFRKYRNLLFPNSQVLENQLELNEGIAEFTGLIISGRDKVQTKEHFERELKNFFNNPTYVRSFAYCTTPIYGYLLYQKNKNWNKTVNAKTDLTELFFKGFALTLTTDIKETALRNSDVYNGQAIFREEAIREENLNKLLAEYSDKLITQSHLQIPLKKMNVSFDPRSIIPLEDKGTIYPYIRITDLWGVLEVKKGALMHPNWNKISITKPTRIAAGKAEGDGWTLELKEGYSIQKEETTSNYVLVKIGE